MGTRLAIAFAQFDRAELRICRALNRSSGLSTPRAFFHAVSRLGDGWLWYALILSQLLLPGGGFAALHFAFTGLAGLAAYMLVKRHAVRDRPFVTHAGIRCAAAPFDRYSFPSGHTLHAVCFAVLGSHYLPELALPLAAFAAHSSRCRASCSACTTRPMSPPAPCSAAFSRGQRSVISQLFSERGPAVVQLVELE